MRVLILSELCNPDWPSVPACAYQLCRAMAEYADVVVATQIRNGQHIERVGLGRAKVVYFDTEMIARPLWRVGLKLRGDPQLGWLIQHWLEYPSYLAFEWLVWRYFRRPLRQGEFDIVYRVTPMTTLLPSFMAQHSPVPIVVGPLNDNLPWAAESIVERQREMKRSERLLAKTVPLLRRLPYQGSTQTRAAAVLAAFEHTIASLDSRLTPKIINYPEVGVNPDVFTWTDRPTQTPLTIVCIGRLVPLKLTDVPIRAFASSALLRRHRLLIVGDGPERPHLERLIADNGLSGCVTLVGQQSQAEVAQIMRQADILAFPSIHELGGNVVVEAMASGLACVVVDYGGPATLIGPERGVKVPIGNAAQLTESFRGALEQLVTQPEWVQQLGRAAYEHATTYYTWDAKARKALEIFRWVLGQQATKPDFWTQPV